jgi:hypothetical protein
MANTSRDDTELTSTALGHAWAWYEMGMGHRLQVANIFMLVVAGNVAAYIAALQAHVDIVAGGVGLAATVLVVLFALMSRRARERVNIAATSLQAIENRIARILDLDELRTIERINSSRSSWRTTAARADTSYCILAAIFVAASCYAFFLA